MLEKEWDQKLLYIPGGSVVATTFMHIPFDPKILQPRIYPQKK